MPTETGTLDLKAIKVGHDDAASTATSYITKIGNAGIRVHPSGSTVDYAQINADGMQIYRNSAKVAEFGAEEVVLGKPKESLTSTGSVSLSLYDDFKITGWYDASNTVYPIYLYELDIPGNGLEINTHPSNVMFHGSGVTVSTGTSPTQLSQFPSWTGSNTQSFSLEGTFGTTTASAWPKFFYVEALITEKYYGIAMVRTSQIAASPSWTEVYLPGSRNDSASAGRGVGVAMAISGTTLQVQPLIAMVDGTDYLTSTTWSVLISY